MDGYKYTIIIPHYDIPQLLMRCLGSIPVREEVQVIVVDDCSPEGEKYPEKYPELTRPFLEYYRTPQGGSAGRARNVGMYHAKGEWLIFMDADDLFVDNMYDLLENNIDGEADVTFFNTRSVMSDDLSQPSKRNLYGTLFERYKDDTSELSFRYDFQSLWGKVFRQSLIEENNVRCDETKYSNDVLFSFMAGHLAKKIKVVQTPLYIVTQRSNSLASSQFSGNTISEEECETRLNISLKIARLIKRYKIPFDYQMPLHLSIPMRQHYPFRYLRTLLRLMVTFPSMFVQMVKRDWKTIRRKIS